MPDVERAANITKKVSIGLTVFGVLFAQPELAIPAAKVAIGSFGVEKGTQGLKRISSSIRGK